MSQSDPLIQQVRRSIGLAGDPAGRRIVCAMSGGVDSSVAAALLKRAGYDVVGITLQLYDHGEAVRRKGACCAGQDIHDARRVAAQLGIPHYVLDFESRFREAVIDDFVSSYAAGFTPVPCIRCNQTVKFADLLAQARALDADALVTGHYVESRPRGGGSGHRDLFTPTDMARDQSYFLFATTQEQIDYLRFPLGALPKSETRRIAAETGLAVAGKPDSQDICFVPEGRYGDLVARLRPDAAVPGDIVHEDGRILGRHKGTVHFTVGQRRGLGVAEGDPLYVLEIVPEKQRVVVGPRASLLRHDIALTQVNWLGREPLGQRAQPVFARIRSTQGPAAAEIRHGPGGSLVSMAQGEYGISPGQACVLYENPGPGARLLGGGFIARSFPAGTNRSLPEAPSMFT
jgi:tRNA-specific 2-thiouridylase